MAKRDKEQQAQEMARIDAVSTATPLTIIEADR
jgi:hypothetical protein